MRRKERNSSKRPTTPLDFPMWFWSRKLMASGACASITRISIKPIIGTPTPYPNIDWLVDGAVGNKVLSFLDAYSGYNQIPMATSDMNKIAFITDNANYFYKVMPFGLKNAGATYQRLMDKVFSHIMGKCVEVYIDDMVVKSPSHHQHAQDLSTVFSALRQYNLRLNPEKCVFSVDRGKFLGFMLTQRGIEANLKKCNEIIEMRSPVVSKKYNASKVD